MAAHAEKAYKMNRIHDEVHLVIEDQSFREEPEVGYIRPSMCVYGN
jgi:hypothetical protein